MKDALKLAVKSFFDSLKDAAKLRPIILMGLNFIESYLNAEIDKLFA